MGNEREALYEQAYGETSAEPEVNEEKKEEVAESPAEKEEASEVKPETDVSEKPEGEVKEEVSEEEQLKGKGDLKSALKEERIKRRQLKSEYEAKLLQKESQLNEVLQSFRQAQEEPQTIDDYEKEIRNLQKKINEIDTWRQSASTKIQEDERQKTYKDLMLRIDSTDISLKDEGYPGFAKFKSLVSEELNKLPEEERAEMDNEQGWREIYKETVFPSIKNTFASVSKEEKLAKKIQDKQNAGMLGESKGEPQIKKDESWSYDDYLTWRKNKVGN